MRVGSGGNGSGATLLAGVGADGAGGVAADCVAADCVGKGRAGGAIGSDGNVKAAVVGSATGSGVGRSIDIGKLRTAGSELAGGIVIGNGRLAIVADRGGICGGSGSGSGGIGRTGGSGSRAAPATGGGGGATVTLKAGG